LETVLRDVGDWPVREVSEDRFYGQLHAELQTAETITVADLRDWELKKLDVARSAVASSDQEHYPCTRTIAKAVHASPQNLGGIVWHSRQAELAASPAAEALVLFADRLVSGREALTLSPTLTAAGAIGEGVGRGGDSARLRAGSAFDCSSRRNPVSPFNRAFRVSASDKPVIPHTLRSVPARSRRRPTLDLAFASCRSSPDRAVPPFALRQSMELSVGSTSRTAGVKCSEIPAKSSYLR